jgi:hypothetical protein
MTARIIEALMGRPSRGLQMAQSPSDRLRDRGYLDKVPPPVANVENWTAEMQNEYARHLFDKAQALRQSGVSEPEAMERARNDPRVRAARERILKRAPQIDPEMRRLLDR